MSMNKLNAILNWPAAFFVRRFRMSEGASRKSHDPLLTLRLYGIKVTIKRTFTYCIDTGYQLYYLVTIDDNDKRIVYNIAPDQHNEILSRCHKIYHGANND